MLSGNDAIKVTINHISAENCASGPLYLHQNVDVPLDENNEPVAAFKGNVRNISIHAFEVESYTGWYMMEIGMPDYYVSSVKIRNVRVPKIAGRGLLRLLAKDAYDVFLQGGVPLDGGVPGYSGPPGAAAYDITWLGARYVGPAAFSTGSGRLHLNTGNAFARDNGEARTLSVLP